MEKTDISHAFKKAVMNYFIEHVVFSTDGTEFMSFVKTFCDATNADDAIVRDELKNRIMISCRLLFRPKFTPVTLTVTLKVIWPAR